MKLDIPEIPTQVDISGAEYQFNQNWMHAPANICVDPGPNSTPTSIPQPRTPTVTPMTPILYLQIVWTSTWLLMAPPYIHSMRRHSILKLCSKTHHIYMFRNHMICLPIHSTHPEHLLISIRSTHSMLFSCLGNTSIQSFYTINTMSCFVCRLQYM